MTTTLRRTLIATAASLASASALAMPMVMTFEGVVAASSTSTPITPYTEAGFTLTNSLGGPTDGIFGSTSGANTNGTDVFGWCAFCGPLTITLTKSGGGVFNFASFDVANLEVFGATNVIDVIGNLFGGGTVSTTITHTDTWTNYVLNYAGVTSVDFSFGPGHNGDFPNHAFDNLTMTMGVPEPGGLALMGLALAGIGLARRRSGSA